MCDKCHKFGSYDATLEQLNHDPVLLQLQNFPVLTLSLWWKLVKACVFILKNEIKTIIYPANNK